MRRSDELARFKREILLPEFAQSLGFEVIKNESRPASLHMRARDDQVIVFTDAADGSSIYFSVSDERDCGSIIDFAQRRLGGTLGQALKALRAWLQGASPLSLARKPSLERPPVLTPVQRDRAELMARWARAQPYSMDYLVANLRLDPELVGAWRVRQDEHGNALFAHRDAVGVCGWESKNLGWTGFSAGGQRGLGLARADAEPVTLIVITGSAIDAMSYCQLEQRPAGVVYVSLDGALADDQVDLLRRLLGRHPQAELVAATGADSVGEAMSERLLALAPERGRRDSPAPHKDWNAKLVDALEPVRHKPDVLR